MIINFSTKIQEIPKIGPKYAKKLEKIGIKTISDLLFHLPFRYDDYSQTISVSELTQGIVATIEATIVASKTQRTWRKRMYITEIAVEDETGTIKAVWFNQPFLFDSLKEGKEIRLSGKVSSDGKKLFFSNPAWELSKRTPTNTGRLVPVYPETEGLSSRWLRWQIQTFLKIIPKSEFLKFDFIPKEILDELHLPNLEKSLRFVHFPNSLTEAELAQKRFAFQEMFLVQLKSLQVRLSWQKEKSVKIKFDEKLIQKFVSNLPFNLTDAQKKSAFQILKDLEKDRPMNRLLNGDVGSGKTIVAAIASLQAVWENFQVAIMAPTEVLARQHFESFCGLFKDYDFNIALLTNSYREMNNFKFRISNFESNSNFQNSNLKIESKFKIQNSKLNTGVKKIILRAKLMEALKNGTTNLVIGTHSLIQKDIKFKNLALIIVDEQHRFGVEQRAHLQKEIEEINDGLKNTIPHLLTMTATPIPRTLALAFFGNLDISVLDEMPKNRKKIITQIVMPMEREKIYNFVRSEIKKGRQCFVILPLVEDSKAMTEVKAAVSEHKRLSEKIFPDLKIGLLHGKLKSNEKEKVMQEFKEKKLSILVATAVVEVGIDVPNATVMLIEDADRFGLSQLHQFRGRVGRGEHQSYCFLFSSSSTQNAKKRLKALEESDNGFKIAEKDLELRGPGEFFGTRQAGIPDIAMKNIANTKLIQISREKAQQILQIDPELKKHPLLKDALKRFDEKVHLE